MNRIEILESLGRFLVGVCIGYTITDIAMKLFM